MFNDLQKRKITINATLAIPLGELAIYVLKRGEDNSKLLDLLHSKPKQVNVRMAEVVRKMLTDEESNIRLKELYFAYYDSDDFSHGASYFDAKLRGRERDLRAITGDDKFFSFNWEENK
jgi:hypothetical protein